MKIDRIRLPKKSWHGGVVPPGLGRLGGQIGRLLDTMFRGRPGREGYEEALETASSAVARANQELEPHARFGGLELGQDNPPEDARPYYVRGSDVGEHNPVFPLVRYEYSDGVTTGTFTAGVAHEGPPGCIHGGVVSLVFDMVLGQHNIDANVPGMTANLSVDYRRPAPLFTELRLVARHETVDGRKITTTGQLWADSDLIAEGTGLFILPRGASD